MGKRRKFSAEFKREAVRSVLYEASTGRFLREETPTRRGNRIDPE